MTDKVLAAIERHGMFEQGDGVVIALSGGADSVALLCALLELKQKLSLSLVACHVNHGLRGSESDADAAFCRALCASLDVELTVCPVDVNDFCVCEGLSTEEGARRLRYRALGQVAQGRKIATAHTLSDSVETVLINLARGTGLDGLCGVPPVRGRIVRPLIEVSRGEVEDYLAAREQHYVTDSTNVSLEYSRNRVRLRVIPELRELSPALEAVVGRTIDLLRCDAAFLEQEARTALEGARVGNAWSAQHLAAQPPALRLRALRRILREGDAPYDQRRLSLCDALLESGSGAVELTVDRRLRCAGGRLWLEREPPAPEAPAQQELAVEALPICLNWGEKQLSLRWLSGQEIKFFVNNRPQQFKNALDCARLDKILILRGRAPGDSFHPSGRPGKTLKKLFNEAGLLPGERRCAALLESRGELVWIEGFGTSSSAALSPDTQNALLVECQAENAPKEDKQRWTT